jgi:hypothetical protein
VLSDRINKALDYRCRFSLKGDYPILSVSRKIGLKCPASVFLRKGMVELRFYISVADESNRDLRILLETSKARKIDGVWIIYSNDRVYPELKIFRELLENTSAVMDYYFLQDGEFEVNFRFSSMDLKKISQILLGFSRFDEMDFKINYLGENPGLTWVLENLNAVEPITVIGFTGHAPEVERTPENNPMGERWIREVRYISDDEQISAVYLTEKEIPEKQYRRKLGNNLYESSTRNSMMNAISKISLKSSVPTVSRVQAVDGEKFDMEFVIPSLYQRQFLKVMSEVTESFPDWDLKLSLISSFDKINAERMKVLG